MPATAPALPDTASASALMAAVEWMENLLLGQLGTALAVLAVAGIGFAMLQGRLAAREGIRVVLGGFILFGASMLARSLTDLAHWTSGPPPATTEALPPPVAIPSPPPPNADPYAGASLPR